MIKSWARVGRWALGAGLLAAVGMGVSAGAAWATTFAELAKFLPDDANAVIVVNAQSLYASPLGQQQGWQQKYADRFEASPLLLPPSATRAVFGTELDLATLKHQWQAAAMELSIDPSMGDIARKRGGRNDVIAGAEVTWLGNQLCVTKLGPKLFGVVTPVTRAEAADWIRDMKSGRAGQFADYLAQSIGYADAAGTDIILAVDLADAFTEDDLRARAEGSDALDGVTAAVAAKILASIQGVKFGVKVTDGIVGRLQLDFAEDVGPLAGVAKPLVLRIVGKAGAMLPEFANWTGETSAKSLAIQGPLTEDGMRRILSLLALDAGALETKEPEPATTATASVDDAKQAMGAASLRYFRGLSKYVDDLQRLGSAASLDQAVMWIENYGRKIEALPTRNVDPELIQYGKYVSQTFYAIVDQASGALDNYDSAQQPVVTNYQIGFLPTARTVNWGGNFQRMYAPYGHENIDVQQTQKNIQQSQEQIDAAIKQAKTTLGQLISDQQTVREKLSEKYGLKF
jgi:hypothetical protein